MAFCTAALALRSSVGRNTVCFRVFILKIAPRLPSLGEQVFSCFKVGEDHQVSNGSRGPLLFSEVNELKRIFRN
jgi:hypothetical protein